MDRGSSSRDSQTDITILSTLPWSHFSMSAAPRRPAAPLHWVRPYSTETRGGIRQLGVKQAQILHHPQSKVVVCSQLAALTESSPSQPPLHLLLLLRPLNPSPTRSALLLHQLLLFISRLSGETLEVFSVVALRSKLLRVSERCSLWKEQTPLLLLLLLTPCWFNVPALCVQTHIHWGQSEAPHPQYYPN